MVSPLRKHRQKPQTVSQRLLEAITTDLTTEKLEADLTSQRCFICRKHKGERTLSFVQSNDEEERLIEQAIELRRFGLRLESDSIRAYINRLTNRSLMNKHEQLFFPEMDPQDPDRHYSDDPIGQRLGLAGAGILAYLTLDQLHPPMVDDEAIWADGRRWYHGAVEHTLAAAELCELQQNHRVLDIGCGVGGPARTLVSRFGVEVFGVTISQTQVNTARAKNAERERWKSQIHIKYHDCQDPYSWRAMHCAWSMNMLYWVRHHDLMIRNAREALATGGKLLIDDWMLTPRATTSDRIDLRKYFGSIHFAVREDLIELVADSGFRIRKVLDLGHIGRTHLVNHVESEFDRCFRQRVERDCGKPNADGFVKGVRTTIDLYQAEKLTYVRLLATKDNS